MPKTKDDTERRKELAKITGLDLDPGAPAKAAKPKGEVVMLAPEGVDPRAMPVSDIVFDPRLLDGFPSLSGAGMSAASRHIFALYGSYGRNKDRNRRLHDEIGLFINRVRRDRETGTPAVPYVKEKVKASKAQRDLAAAMAERGLTEADLLALLDERSEG